jgi:hypothetical protein
MAFVFKKQSLMLYLCFFRYCGFVILVIFYSYDVWERVNARCVCADNSPTRRRLTARFRINLSNDWAGTS